MTNTMRFLPKSEDLAALPRKGGSRQGPAAFRWRTPQDAGTEMLDAGYPDAGRCDLFDSECVMGCDVGHGAAGAQRGAAAEVGTAGDGGRAVAAGVQAAEDLAVVVDDLRVLVDLHAAAGAGHCG